MTMTTLSPPPLLNSAPPSDLLGHQTPRIWTPRDEQFKTMGPLMAKVAEIAGIDFDPWQHLVAGCGMELQADGKWLHRGVCILVARQNGKTVILEARILTGLFALEDERLILHTAQDRAVPRKVFESMVETIRTTPSFRRRIPRRGIRETNGQERITAIVNGAKSTYRIMAPRAAAFRTWSADLLIFDEGREQKTTDLWSAAIPTQRARPNPQWWMVSNAGTIDSVVLNGLIKRGRAAADFPEQDRGICYMEWSAAGGRTRDMHDPAAWQEANPALGRRLTTETIVEDIRTLSLEADGEAGIRTEILCQPEAAIVVNPAIPPAKWAECGGPGGAIEVGIPRPFMAVDVDGDRTNAALSIAVVRDERLVVDVVEQWSGEIDLTEIGAAAVAYMKTYKIRDFAYDRRAADHIASIVDKKRSGSKLHAISTTDYVIASANLYDAVTTGYLSHRHNPDLDHQMSLAAKKTTAEGAWYLSRAHSPEPISAVIATAFAVHLAYRPRSKPTIHST